MEFFHLIVNKSVNVIHLNNLWISFRKYGVQILISSCISPLTNSIHPAHKSKSIYCPEYIITLMDDLFLYWQKYLT